MNAPRNQLDNPIFIVLERDGGWLYVADIAGRLGLERREHSRIMGTLRRLLAHGVLEAEYRRIESGSGRPRRYFRHVPGTTIDYLPEIDYRWLASAAIERGTDLDREIADVLREDGGMWTAAEIADWLYRKSTITNVNRIRCGVVLDDLVRLGLVERESRSAGNAYAWKDGGHVS
jgi:predicted transcriptional regulator